MYGQFQDDLGREVLVLACRTGNWRVVWRTQIPGTKRLRRVEWTVASSSKKIDWTRRFAQGSARMSAAKNAVTSTSRGLRRVTRIKVPVRLDHRICKSKGIIQ